jgi:hypothetical protein
VRLLGAALAVAMAAGCVESNKARRPTAYFVNSAVMAVGAAAVVYGVTRLSSPPKDRLDQFERDAGGDVLYALSAVAGVAMMGGATAGVIGTMTSEQAGQADKLQRAISESASVGGGDALPASAVHDPPPEVRRLALEARLAAAGGDCHGAIAADQRIRDLDPDWHAAVFSRDTTVASCRVMRMH